MDERLQVVINNAIAALRDLVHEVPLVAINHNMIDNKISIFVRDVKDLARIPGLVTMTQWGGQPARWVISKEYSGVEFMAAASQWEIAGIAEVAASEQQA